MSKSADAAPCSPFCRMKCRSSISSSCSHEQVTYCRLRSSESIYFVDTDCVIPPRSFCVHVDLQKQAGKGDSTVCSFRGVHLMVHCTVPCDMEAISHWLC
ncbi:hypothetical protein CHARACLAT_020876 [Characodon lateralis]|uniref:Uncharacterized protein n=1 Tax=Characodon lateralis TaxID=208331 RepID=A0ABU7EVF2_9TELE|nr:hypothetical protein [Characodon lateralis]